MAVPPPVAFRFTPVPKRARRPCGRASSRHLVREAARAGRADGAAGVAPVRRTGKT